ncbi:hypothetical protein NIL11_27005, partial [Klebsiella pneumoniae]|uniref:hypothetical protein n=1 Tax=Klebsiella pneumoniae TaxID=573 RepID=UPI0021F784FC
MKQLRSSMAVLSLLLIVGAPAVAQPVVRIQQVEDVLTQWRPDRQLFVKGDLGIDATRYTSLAAWLAENGPH